MAALHFVGILLLVLLVFNLLIIVHELGHFLAARWRGLIVEQFGIWFGRSLWEKKIGGVVYSLGSIPAGGFVKLPQLAPMEALEGKSELVAAELPPVGPLDKIIVAFAGPLFSFGLAAVFAVLVWAVGKPTTESEMTTVIGWVEPGSPAAAAGLRPGDRILEVDGRPVKRFVGMVNSVTWRVIRSEGPTIAFKVERAGRTVTIESGFVKGDGRKWGRKGLRQVRIAPLLTPVVGEVEPGGPAAAAGLRRGDEVVAVNGEPVFNPAALSATIEANPTAPVTIGVRRGAGPLAFTMTPVPMPDPIAAGRAVGGPEEEGAAAAAAGPTRPRVGIVWDLGEFQLSHPDPGEQLADSTSTIFNMLGALFSPKSDVKAQHFSGPVGIMRLYYMMFENPQGWRLALWFSVVLNVNLALLNLFPIPVLDGGHIVLAIVEGIRRRPVNAKVVEAVTTVCALLLIGFMLYVTFFDLQDLPWPKLGRGAPTPAATK